MTGILIGAALLLFGLVAAGLAIVWLILAAAFWLLLLPFRLLFWLVAVPLGLLKFVLVGIGAALFGIVAVIVSGAVAFALLVAVIAPLLPIVIVGGLVWGLWRLVRGPSTTLAAR